jgi:hypothetical protein
MPRSPTPNPSQPTSAGTVVDVLGRPASIDESRSTLGGKTSDPFVSCFSTDRPSSAVLSKGGFLRQPLPHETPALFF